MGERRWVEAAAIGAALLWAVVLVGLPTAAALSPGQRAVGGLGYGAATGPALGRLLRDRLAGRAERAGESP